MAATCFAVDIESCTARRRSRYSPCFWATFSSSAATSLFFAIAIDLVVASKDLPGIWRAEHIHEEDDMHIDMPMMRSSFIMSIPRRPSIIIQHSYEPTHRASNSPSIRAKLIVSPKIATFGNASIATSSLSRLWSIAGSPIVQSIDNKVI